MYNMHVQGLFSESHMCVILYISLHRVQRKMPQMCNKRLCNQHIHAFQTLNKTRKRNVQHTCLKMLLIKTNNVFASNFSLRRCLYILNYMQRLYPARRKIVTLSFTLEIYMFLVVPLLWH